MLKVIVCGTTFGKNYIDAIKKIDKLKLVGILASGSKRSFEYAKKNHVPLFKNVDMLPRDIDIAFVVIGSSVLGGSGTNIALSLLRKGISVMQEHPVNYKEIQECYKEANCNGVFYRIGNLYNSLNNLEVFKKCTKYLNKNDELNYVDILTSSQMVYTQLSILNSTIPSFRNFRINASLSEKRYPFSRVVLSNGNTNINMQIHNEISNEDKNNYMYVLHRMTYFYGGGRLELEDTFGSVVWRSRMYVSEESEVLNKELNIKCLNEEEIKFKDLISSVFSNCIVEEIKKFIHEINSKKANASLALSEILISQKWSEIMKEIGFPISIQQIQKLPYHSSKIKEIGEKYGDRFIKK